MDGSSVPSSYLHYYNINSVLGNAGIVIEGEDAVFNVTRSGAGSESTIYVSTFICDDEVGCANISDFNSLDHFAVNFGKDDLVKEVRVSTILDDIKEANESFYLRMNKGASGDNYEYGVIDKVTITETTGILGSLALGNSVGSTGWYWYSNRYCCFKNFFPGVKAGQFYNDSAFAAVTTNNKVVSWGNNAKGGDSTAVNAHLTNVSKIYTNTAAFAAIKTDGSVVTWGDVNAGGTSWDSDGLSVSATLSGSGNLTLGGASTSGGSATFSKGNKVTITSAGG